MKMMDAPTPASDGELNRYQAKLTYVDSPRVYYVNGMLTDGAQHRDTSVLLSAISERVIHGIYNRTDGAVLDFAQCLNDWLMVVSMQLFEFPANAIDRLVGGVRRILGRSSNSTAGDVFRSAVPEVYRVDLMIKFLRSQNPASATLLAQLLQNIGQRQLIVCHSQGNLVTSSALWGLQVVAGEAAFHDIQVFSLASPSPAWPESLNYRIKVYGHENDLVTWADIKRLWRQRSAGDWRRWHEDRLVGLGGHGVDRNIFGTNFANRLRNEVGLPMISAFPQPTVNLRPIE